MTTPPVQTEEEKAADDAIIQRAQDAFKLDKDHWDPIYNKARDDLKFLSDEPAAQWNSKDYSERTKTGRPALTIDYLSQFVHQVANDIRMNEPSINVIPVGSESSIETAAVFKGLIKKIEYTSSAAEAYDSAVTSAIKCSIGYIRVDHDYVDPSGGFDQQLLIQRVINPFIVYPDRASIESDGCDMNHCTILEKMKVAEFKRLHPHAALVGFEASGSTKEPQDDDDITIAEFFTKATEEKELVAPDGVTKRTIKTSSIMRYRLAGQNVLSRTTFPGEYIPVVPVYGEEAWIDGKRELFSLIRKAKQAQMMYNLHKSLETEILMKQPQAPVMTPAGAIDNYKDDWLNPSKSMALRYDMRDSDGNPYNKPERLAPATIPAGFANAALESVNDIKATMGLYNASIGQKSNEVSGVAINARKVEGDVATYHYGDNLVRSLTQVGRILVSAAPVIYDTTRIIDILNEEDEPETVEINGVPAAAEGTTPEEQKIAHDFSKGKYDVRVTTGASFTTKRQEAAQFFEGIVKQQPDLMKVMGDLLFKNMDFAGAQQMASRMKKLIDPKLLEGEDGKGPDPQVAALQQALQEMQAKMEEMAQQGMKLEEQLKNKDAATQGKIQNDSEKNSIAAMQVKLDQMQALIDNSLRSRELDITEQKNAGELAIASQQTQIESLLAVMQRIEAAVTPQQSPQGDPAANIGAGNSMGGP